MRKRLFWIGFGSAVGGSLRHVPDIFLSPFDPSVSPFLTLFINMSGCLLVGLLTGRWHGASPAPFPSEKGHFWVTGVCGGYTTFSAFGRDFLTMIEAGRSGAAALYVLSTLTLAWIALRIGVRIARLFPVRTTSTDPIA